MSSDLYDPLDRGVVLADGPVHCLVPVEVDGQHGVGLFEDLDVLLVGLPVTRMVFYCTLINTLVLFC